MSFLTELGRNAPPCTSTTTGSTWPKPATVTVGYVTAGVGAGGRTAYTIDEFRLRREEVYTGPFTPPATLAPPDFPDAVWTPGTVTLSSIIDAELARNEAVDLADFDTSACDAITVRGYKCTGSPAESIAKICEIFFVDLVPGNPLRFVGAGARRLRALPVLVTSRRFSIRLSVRLPLM